MPVLATTATANDRVVADIVEQLGEGVRVFRGPLARDSLKLDAIVLGDQAERLAWLAEILPRLPGSGIVYCLTVADTQRVATFLTSQGIDARAYNASLSTEEREALEDALIANDMKALVATVALGMGFDKPDLGFVVHYQRPGSAIAYYQQVGRAGRAVDDAYGVLLSGREDDDIAEYFMRSAFPPTVHMQAILTALEDVDSMSAPAIERKVNLPKGQITQALKLLELDGAVARDGSRYLRTPNPWQQDEERIERVLAARRLELGQMQAYMRHDGCYMEFLARLLDDPAAAPCGRCSNDVGRGLRREVDPDRVHRGGLVPQARPAIDQAAAPVAGGCGARPVGADHATERDRLRPLRVRRRGVGESRPARQVRGRRLLQRNSSWPRLARSAIAGGLSQHPSGSRRCPRRLSAASSTGSRDRWPPNLAYPTWSACPCWTAPHRRRTCRTASSNSGTPTPRSGSPTTRSRRGRSSWSTTSRTRDGR